MGSLLDEVLGVFEQDAVLPYDNRYVWTAPAWLLHGIVNNLAFSEENGTDRRFGSERTACVACPSLYNTYGSMRT